MTGREKWQKYLAGDDVGPMVCPLCDKWCVGDVEYRWRNGPEPFAGDETREFFRGQIMMVKEFKWDALFYAAIKFQPNNKAAAPRAETHTKDGMTYTTTTISTPAGNLTQLYENNGLTNRCVKNYLEDESDYEKMLWYTDQVADFDRAAALADGRVLREAAGDIGIIGTWVSPSAMVTDIQSLYYHVMDYPEAYRRLQIARFKLTRSQLEVYRDAGFDFMFYCVPSTDSTSPDFFRERMADEVRETIAWWKSFGGFTLWHGCGHVKAYIEQGVFNDMKPEMLETLSEPPVGNVPSLAWARKQIDPGIITKGNIPLDILYEGTPDAVREAVRRVKRETEGYRHIIGLSDNILTGTPRVNLQTYVDEGYK